MELSVAVPLRQIIQRRPGRDERLAFHALLRAGELVSGKRRKRRPSPLMILCRADPIAERLVTADRPRQQDRTDIQSRCVTGPDLPKPWRIEPMPNGYRVIDANGIVLAHVFGQPDRAIAVSDTRSPMTRFGASPS
jgi:hypothetical protein